MSNKILSKILSQKIAMLIFFFAAMSFLGRADISMASGISVVPSITKVNPGEKFYIDVVVDNIPAEGLGAIQFRLNVNAPGSAIVAVSDTTLAGTGEISVATPLIIGPPVPNRSGIGDFFLNGAGPHGILVMDNEDLKNGSALYTFGHTNGAVPPQGSGSVARFSFAVGKDVSAEKIEISLSEVMLLNAGVDYVISDNTGAIVEFGCMAIVPNLSGLSQNDAQAALENAGFSIGNIQEIDNWSGTYALNKVLSQSYAAGASIPCGTSVDLTINIAPSEVGSATAVDKTGDENGAVVLSWLPSASLDTAGYMIYLVSGAQSLLNEIRNPSANGFEITGLTNGLPSQLRITAFDNSGNESQGVFVSATPLDDVPPRVVIAGVAESTFYKSDVVPVITVEDANLSTKEITLDGTLYNLNPISADGNHILLVVAKDTANNTTTKEIHFVIDKTAPVLTVSTLSDGSWTNNQILNVAGEVTDNIGVQQCTINDTVVTINPDGSFSYPITLQDGPNTIGVKVTDLAGNEASDTRTVNFDVGAPIITIASPLDNMKTNQAAIDVTGTVGEQSTVTVKVNDADPVPVFMNGNDFSLTETMVYGINTIEVTATDLAGNMSAVKRTVTFDDRNPSLSITDPAQDLKTHIADLVIKGVVADFTDVTVRITVDDSVYVPVVTNGRFEQTITFMAEKTYQIYVSAMDEAGNETIVQRNVIYDITSPSFTLDPVTTPTNLNSQTLTGTMAAGATVNVTCPTATVSEVAYPTATTWMTTLSNMQEGDNNISITAADEAGNVSPPIFAVIVVNMTPAVTISPLSSAEEIGRIHTVTAALSNEQSGVPMIFSVISGPNAGAVGICSLNPDCTTNVNGQVSFTYAGVGGTGTDEINACFIDIGHEGTTICSQVATQQWTYPACDASSSNASNFNGTPISAGNYIWFNSIVKVDGRGSNSSTIRFAASKIEFNAGGKNYEISVPGAEIVFSPAATVATTSFEGNKWMTVVPLNYTGNVFLSGLAFQTPAGGLPGGINPVTWSGYFMTDTPGVSVQWKWAAAVYTSFDTDYNTVGVKPIDGSSLNNYNNSDHAGTPEHFKTFVIGGARGGGGSNYTGGYSGTLSKSPCLY